jgi:hypothetical protein
MMATLAVKDWEPSPSSFAALPGEMKEENERKENVKERQLRCCSFMVLSELWNSGVAFWGGGGVAEGCPIYLMNYRLVWELMGDVLLLDWN